MTHSIFISTRTIQSRIRSLAKEIDEFYRGQRLVIIGVLNGCSIFLPDLVRQLKIPLQFDFISTSSYGQHLKSQGKVQIRGCLKVSLKNAHLLIIDDILDSGLTLHALIQRFKRLHPLSLRTCVLLNKKVIRQKCIQADFVGFEISNHFVYGYGLDLAEEYRNLSFIARFVDGK